MPRPWASSTTTSTVAGGDRARPAESCRHGTELLVARAEPAQADAARRATRCGRRGTRRGGPGSGRRAVRARRGGDQLSAPSTIRDAVEAVARARRPSRCGRRAAGTWARPAHDASSASRLQHVAARPDELVGGEQRRRCTPAAGVRRPGTTAGTTAPRSGDLGEQHPHQRVPAHRAAERPARAVRHRSAGSSQSSMRSRAALSSVARSALGRADQQRVDRDLAVGRGDGDDARRRATPVAGARCVGDRREQLGGRHRWPVRRVRPDRGSTTTVTVPGTDRPEAARRAPAGSARGPRRRRGCRAPSWRSRWRRPHAAGTGPWRRRAAAARRASRRPTPW